MAAFVEVKNVNPAGAVNVIIDGYNRTVPAGGVIKVSPEVAGFAPAWRPVDPERDTPLALAQHEVRPVGEGDQQTFEVLDLGEGLLAQPENWTPVAGGQGQENK